MPAPILPFNSLFVASHKNHLGFDAPRFMAVAPTRLESTCVVVATGGSGTFHVAPPPPSLLCAYCHALTFDCFDLGFFFVGGVFVWRAAPSGAFDVLAESFGYGQLLVTIAAVVVATIIVRHLSNRKQLKAAWT